MRRLPVLVLLATATVLAGSTLAVAGGGRGTVSPERAPAPPAARPSPSMAEPTATRAPTSPSTTTTTAQEAEAAVPDAAAAELRPEPPDRPHRPEQLRLHCEGVATDAGRGVACRWSASQHPDFAGYRLLRGDGEQREVVFRTRDIGVLRHLDTTVEPGQRYRYAIQVLDDDGRVIGQGGPVVAGIPEPSFEVVRFGCERSSDGEHRGITCRWSAATGEVRGYVLYRSVDGGPREAIYRTGVDGRLGHFDGPLRPGHRYTYAVVVLDAAGEVGGGGGPVTIGIPPPTAGPLTDVRRSAG